MAKEFCLIVEQWGGIMTIEYEKNLVKLRLHQLRQDYKKLQAALRSCRDEHIARGESDVQFAHKCGLSHLSMLKLLREDQDDE